MKHILEQYVDLQTEIKYLADKIDRVERRLYDLSHDMVSDSVTKGKKGKKPLVFRKRSTAATETSFCSIV